MLLEPLTERTKPEVKVEQDLVACKIGIGEQLVGPVKPVSAQR